MKKFLDAVGAHPERLTGRQTRTDDELDFEREGVWVYDFTRAVVVSGPPEVSVWIEENRRQ